MRLATHGDYEERRYWHAFIEASFPAYERFWLDRVVPLTGRTNEPLHLGFLSRDELGSERDEDIAIAQLHYTTLLHVGHVHDLLHQVEARPHLPPMVKPGRGSVVASALAVSNVDFGPAPYSYAPAQVTIPTPIPLDMNTVTEAFVRLAAALDVADELLGRIERPQTYIPWVEREGKRAREAWRSTHGDPLRAIVRYRNRLVHGRVVPFLKRRAHSWFPRIDRVDAHLDWRSAMEDDSSEAAMDFEPAEKIVGRAWDDVIEYLEFNWRTYLTMSK